MTFAVHKDLVIANSHIPYSFTYASISAMRAATGLVFADVGKFCRVTDTNSIWMLSNNAPVTWVSVSKLHGNDLHTPDLLTSGGNRSDSALDVLGWGESKSVEGEHIHITRDTTKAYFADPFIGESLFPEWTTTVTGSSSVALIAAQGGQCRIRASGTIGQLALLRMGTSGWLTKDWNNIFRARAAITSSANTATQELGFEADANNYIKIYHTGIQLDWFCKTAIGGVETSTAMGLGENLNGWYDFKIVTSNTDVKFYADGFLKATHTTNLPTVSLYPFARVTLTGSATRDLSIDYISLTQDREA